MIIEEETVYDYEPQWKLPPAPIQRLRHSDIERGSTTLEWDVPEVDFERFPRIRSWIIDRKDDVRPAAWRRLATLPPKTTRYEVRDLRDDYSYRFRLFSDTNEGYSLPIEYELPAYVVARPTDAPHRPVGPMIVTKLSPHSVQIEWRPPLDDGGDAVRGYVVEMTEGFGAWRKVGYAARNETDFTISGLTEGSSYFFRVFAENTQGLSRPLQSDCVVPTPPIVVPKAPVKIKTQNAQKDSVLLEWEAPLDDGGARITGYVIEKRDMRRARWSYVHRVAPTVRRYEVPGLLAGAQYMFRVRPVNRAGVGEGIEHDEPVTVSCQFRAPSAPAGAVKVTNVTSDSCQVRWQAPDDDGGAPVSSYVIELRETSRSVWRRVGIVNATTTSYKLTSLDAKEDYFIRVIARNREGESFPAISPVVTLKSTASTPNAPSMLQITGLTRDSVSLEWISPIYNGGRDVMRYVIVMQRRPFDTWEEVGHVSPLTTTYTVHNLKEGKEYLFGVYAMNAIGKGDQLETVRPVTPRRFISKPKAPKRLDVRDVSYDSVSLSWSMPDETDSTLVTGYRVEKREVAKTTWERVATLDASETSYTVRSLRSGANYYFRVVALNMVGDSQPLTLDQPIIPKSVYGLCSAPRGPLDVSDITHNSVRLSWQPPSDDGGVAITGYVIERRELASTNWVRCARVKAHMTSYTVTTLTENSEYFFRVRAENIEGLGDGLQSTTAVTPKRPASRPEPPSGNIRVARLGSDSVVLEWNPPYDNGGHRILHYTVEYRDLDSRLWNRAATVDAYTRTVTISGLVENVDYLFRIVAVNEMGESDPLEVDITVRPHHKQAPPSAPSGPLVISDVMRNSVTLNWQPPASDGGSMTTGYIIELKDLLGLAVWTRVDRVSAHTYNYTCTHLLEGSKYLFKVIAENAHGRSVPLETSASVETRSPFTPAEAPATLRVVGISDETVKIEWSAPTHDGGSPVTAYVIEKREATSIIWSRVASVGARVTSYTFKYLETTSSYYVRVAAETEEGVGAWLELRDAVRPRKPLSLPGAPRGLHVEFVNRDTVTLRWSPPDVTGDVPLCGYVIEQQEGNASGRWKTIGYTDPYRMWWTIHHLIQGYQYNYRVRAENPDGAGEAAQLTQPIVPKPLKWRPGSPCLLEVIDITEDSVTLSWLSPEKDGGARVQRYVVELRDFGRAEGWVKVKEVESCDFLVACVENLREGKPYLFRVYAVNEVGDGPAAELRDAVVPRSSVGAPSVPEGPVRVIRVTRSMLALHWHPPMDNGGAPIEKYVVEKREVDRSHWSATGTCANDVTAYCVTDLQENTPYYFRIFAVNAYGVSQALETTKPIVPRRIFETAGSVADIEAWMSETSMDSLQRSRVLQEISVSESRIKRNYSAYTDQQLTSSVDTLDASVSMLSHVFRYTAE